MADKVLLIGMVGAGKSAVGTALSARLGWPYLDNDTLLERAAGSSARDLVATQGEQGLRQAESRVLTLMLGMPGPMIGSVPGAVVLDAADRVRLTEAPCHVVWLRASPTVLARRLGTGAERDWLGADPVATLRRLAADRHDFYEQVAGQIVDVDALPVGAVAKRVAEALQRF